MSYTFPKIYEFPPFYTKQPNDATFEAQLENWKDVILGYCKFNNIWILSESGSKIVSEPTEEDEYETEVNETDNITDKKVNIFQNDRIDRRASTELINDIFKHLVSTKNGEWINPANKRQGMLILWYTIEEWAHILYGWIDVSGQNGSILTLYEIQYGDMSKSQEFSGICTTILVKVLEVLVKQGKATLVKDEGKISGVKFL